MDNKFEFRAQEGEGKGVRQRNKKRSAFYALLPQKFTLLSTGKPVALHFESPFNSTVVAKLLHLLKQALLITGASLPVLQTCRGRARHFFVTRHEERRAEAGR